MPPSDTHLLKAARQGDARAMDELLAKHEPHVYRFGLRLCGSEQDARDVLQQTLMTAFEGLHQFRGEAALSTWLFQVARSYCIKTRRRRAGEPSEYVPLDAPQARDVPETGEGPEEAAHAREMAAVLQEALLALPEGQREVLLLRDVDGLSAEEAARSLGIEVGALKSRLHRARGALRARLAGRLGRPEDEDSPTPEGT
ncbi:sigma-70 family RNA polymerase sigma factor [Myxococcaceae bacterium GXIMD 01537]